MPHATTIIAFALVAFGMVVTPGPNMLYLVSRSIAQGTRAAMISLVGVATALLIYMVAAALGITALLLAIPLAYDALRIAGALYLLWMAWNAIRPGGRSPFQVRDLPADGPRKLYVMGLLTCLLNPKVAVLYLSLLPQFIDPKLGHVLGQSLLLGATQIAVSVATNGTIAASAGSIARLLARKPAFMTVQRWLMATVLGGLAVRMAFETRK
ncbi:LysE family translocator [Sphingomonas naphthae]|uniref:LysE family translocator n=1 Tax=Sphingomonas naphthae TaxID=1813468 RepID=A0ABY7TN41_9SPHN|nr:LysE family translocator [Sphingomonas naphthae]WCT74614.1 LysE family translocator [Sphingomonas naphthae]